MPVQNTNVAEPYLSDFNTKISTKKDTSLTDASVSMDVLTSREISVLSLIIQGSTNREAGGILGISPRTIEFHRANIMQKFSARNVAELMRIVLRER